MDYGVLTLILSIVAGIITTIILPKENTVNKSIYQAKVDEDDNKLNKALIDNDDTQLDIMFNDVLVNDSAEKHSTNSAI